MRNFETLLDLKGKGPVIEVGRGEATYRMKRGTFKTKDKITGRRTLPFKKKEGTVLHFTDGTAACTLTILEEDHTVMRVECDEGYDRFWLHLYASEDEHIYGCGEQFAAFDLKGRTVPIWVSERHSVKKLLKKAVRERLLGVNPDRPEKFSEQATYYKQPSFMSSEGYMVHAESDSYAEFTFGSRRSTLFFREIPKRIHLFFAEAFTDLAGRFNRFIGIQRPLPVWTGEGVILAPQGGIDKVKKAIKTAREAGVPVVGVWSQDWSGHLKTSFGYQVLWDWTADEDTYPDLKAKIKDWKEEGIRFLGYINTFLKEDTPLFNEAEKKGYLVRNRHDDPYLIESTTFKAGIFDLTNPDAYAWVKALIKREMIAIGMSGWMADFGEYLPTDAVLHGGRGVVWHNRWPDLWAQVNRDAIEESGSDAFFFSRAAYSGTLSSTNTLWIGDQHVDFSDAYGLGSVVNGLLSVAVSGAGTPHSDTGGYTTIFHMRRSAELFMRWAELNAFTPLFRLHEGNRPESNVQFSDPRVLSHFARMARVYKALNPYIRALKKTYQTTGLPVIRPLFYHYGEPWCFTARRVFMLGRDLIVYPVLRDRVTTMDITLPDDTFVRLGTDETYGKGTHSIDVPIGFPAVFYRKESEWKPVFETLSFNK